MYLKYYNLKEKPFQISSDPKFLWLGETHKEALAILKYGVEDNKGFLLITGDVGTGKTTLINTLLNSLQEDVLVANVPDPGLEPLDFFNFISYAFNINKVFASKGGFLLEFSDFLFRAHTNRQKVLLIIDEAQRLNHKLLEEIRLLSNIEKQHAKLIDIFFVGQNEFNDIITKPENRALRQRITITHHIDPLTAAETGDYVRYRLGVAGSQREIFAADAIHEIYVHSQGYPRVINIICDLAMLSGYVKELDRIGADIVRQCAQELLLTDTPSRDEQKPPAVEVTQVKPEKRQDPIRIGLAVLVVLLLIVAGYFYFSGKERPVAFRPANTAPQSSIKRIPIAEKDAPDAAQTHPPAVPVPSQPEQKAPEPASAGEQSTTAPQAELPAAESDTTSSAGAGSDQSKTESLSIPSVGSQILTEQADIKATAPADPDQSETAEMKPTVPGEDEVARSTDLSHQKFIIHFEFGSNDLSEDAFKTLNRLVDSLNDSPDANIMIKGYTDSAGDVSFNQRLSQFRANLVKTYLVGRGISPSRIITLGLGPENPIADNDTVEGRRTNRRVEIEPVIHPAE